jgi:hypothetical protein
VIARRPQSYRGFFPSDGDARVLSATGAILTVKLCESS